MRTPRPGCGLMRRLSFFLFAILALSATEAAGQLISPGRLSVVHADLEGIRQCTTCHAFRQRGASAARCLDCHVPLAERIEAETGYHGQLEAGDCAACHKEHFGREFDVRRLDEQAFSHDSTGFSLRGSHTGEDCRTCHAPELIDEAGVLRFKTEHGALSRTFLGLPGDCATCHVSDDPHDSQFSERGCADCHDEEVWEAAPVFDHTDTRYPLEGEHRDVTCSSCHGDGPDVAYAPTESTSCSSCHDDPHDETSYGSCADCHSVAGWYQLDRRNVEQVFDHSETDFGLSGAHAGAECSLCHTARGLVTTALHISPLRGTADRVYPIPAWSSCASCHVDTHGGELTPGTSGGACESCHGDFEWSPSTFGLARHEVDTAFPLTGAHLTTPCTACHNTDARRDTAPTFSVDSDCAACHQADDPHEARFGTQSCAQCHQTDDFIVTAFDHDAAALAGQLDACTSCHAEDDPHQTQFLRQECSECHTTEGFTIAGFDHDQTSYPLDGAHSEAPCAACHKVERWPDGREAVRYLPLASDCSSCHTGGTS